MSLRTYPIKRPSTAPATGRMLYAFLLENLKVPAASSHNVWKAGLDDQLERPDASPFRGKTPAGKTLELNSLAGKPVDSPYTLTGKESFLLVSDLSDASRAELGIPVAAKPTDKVYNLNFGPYEDLPALSKMSNELAVLSVAKSISSYLAGVEKKVNYSEADVAKFLMTALSDLSSPEMMHLLHGNHIAWATLAYVREEGSVAGDIAAEFHAQNAPDFYTKDIGTILPTVFFLLASLGYDPMLGFNKIDTYIWGAKEAAKYMRQYMPQEPPAAA